MSYILEALKKADQQRELGKVPGIDASHDSDKRTVSRLPWIVVAVLLVNAGVLLAVLFWPEDAVDKGSPSQVATAPAAIEAPVAVRRAEPLTRPPVPQTRTLKPIPVPAPAVKSEPVPMEIDPDAARLALARSLLPSDMDAEPMVEATRTAPVERIVEEPAAEVAAPAGEPELPVWPQIPANLFQQLSAGLRLDVHVFADLAENRFVLLNMRKYYEGQRLQEGPVLDEITPEGVILSFRGQRFRVHAQ